MSMWPFLRVLRPTVVPLECPPSISVIGSSTASSLQSDRSCRHRRSCRFLLIWPLPHGPRPCGVSSAVSSLCRRTPEQNITIFISSLPFSSSCRPTPMRQRQAPSMGRDSTSPLQSLHSVVRTLRRARHIHSPLFSPSRQAFEPRRCIEAEPLACARTLAA